MLLLGRNGWLVARLEGGKITLTPAGNVDPGRIAGMHDLANGVLIGAEKGLLGACAGWRVRRVSASAARFLAVLTVTTV